VLSFPATLRLMMGWAGTASAPLATRQACCGVGTAWSGKVGILADIPEPPRLGVSPATCATCPRRATTRIPCPCFERVWRVHVEWHARLLLKKVLEILNDKDIEGCLGELILGSRESATLQRKPDQTVLSSLGGAHGAPTRGWEAVGRADKMAERHSSADSSLVGWCEAKAFARDLGGPAYRRAAGQSDTLGNNESKPFRLRQEK